jgi:diguanylate cyclase (GGDEF)-like protein/PAS domain S-box-containing protein
MSELHSLLLRQIRKWFPDGASEESAAFIEAVNSAYHQFDDDRRMLERSLELSSKELIETNNELRAIFEAVPDLFLRVGRDGKVLDAKSRGDADLHFPPIALFREAVQLVVEKKTLSRIEYSIARKGETEFFEARLVPLPQHDEIVVIIRNITVLKRTEEELKRGLSLLQSTLESTADGILVVDNQGRIVSFNQRFPHMWRIPKEIMASRDDALVRDYVLDQLADPQRYLEKIRELYAAPTAESHDELHFRDGRVFERYSMPQMLDGVPVGRVWSFRNITMRHQAEERLLHDAIHDAVTGLPNRTLFIDRLDQAIRHSKRHLGDHFAMLFIDVDRFKVVNDSMGHVAGDELLVAIAGRIRETIRPSDTVARLSGDEFAVLLDTIEKPEDAVIAAERIQSFVSAPFNLRGREVFLTVSIGIVGSAPHYVRAEEMLRDADIAMYRAKAMGRAGYEWFHPGMHTSAVELLHLENELRRALERGEMVLHYQPIVRLADSRIIGFEALLRWNHPRRGLTFPNEFITLAEQTGLIVPIGRWALQEACTRMQQWQKSFGREDLAISVNLSGRQLVHPTFVPDVQRVLSETLVPPHTLCLEITESMLMENSESASETIAQLRALGVKVHIDDFGTGYSSLSYLHRFAIDTLKIDRSFISHIATGEENMDIVRTIMNLAENLKVSVIAEGIENDVQRTQLIALGCQAAQGNFFSKPADEATVRTMIGSGRFPGQPVPLRTEGPQLRFSV